MTIASMTPEQIDHCQNLHMGNIDQLAAQVQTRLDEIADELRVLCLADEKPSDLDSRIHSLHGERDALQGLLADFRQCFAEQVSQPQPEARPVAAAPARACTLPFLVGGM